MDDTGLKHVYKDCKYYNLKEFPCEFLRFYGHCRRDCVVGEKAKADKKEIKYDTKRIK